tara:strand:- start:64 stop:579 length:516 start_codon:yes stop_codon:yes gene_type:complete
MFVNSPYKQFGKLYSEKAAYCANTRYAKIYELLKSSNMDVIYIDVDNIVNKDLNFLYDLLKENELVVVPCLKNDPRISTTLFGLKNTANNIQLFHDIQNLVNTKKYDWGIDHIAFNKFLKDRKFLVLPETYYDEQCDEGSVIWVNHLTMYGITDKYQKIVNEIHFCSDRVL